MSISEKERESMRALVEESKETEEIARKLNACLKRDRGSVSRMRAVRTGLGIESLTPPPPDETNDDPEPVKP
jgi:hypothetical protein